MTVVYAREQDLSVDDYCATITETSLRNRRPLDNKPRIKAMLDGANFIVTARNADGTIVGLARCMTDDAWVCYCAELAVRESHQGQGIGKKILNKVREILGPGIGLVLMADPEAVAFYDRIGMTPNQAFFFERTDRT